MSDVGIPDFRGPEGAWTLRAQGRERAGKAVSTLQAIPTATHMALVELQDRGLLKYVVSQNCDGLHRRSGILSVSLFGLAARSWSLQIRLTLSSSFTRRISPNCTAIAIESPALRAVKSTSEVNDSNDGLCMRHSTHYLTDFRAVSTYERSIHDHYTGRKCVLCGGKLLDSIINFGEPLPAKHIDSAFSHARTADLCLVLGSSVRVTPASEIPQLVGQRKPAKLVICNLQDTPLDSLASLQIHARSDDLMVRVMDQLNLPIPKFVLRRHLSVSVITKAALNHEVIVRGLDSDGTTPASFLRSVKLENSRRVIRKEPFVIPYREELKPDARLALGLEFMGHYAEPNLRLEHICEGHSSLAEMQYLLSYDPETRLWSSQQRNHDIDEISQDVAELSVP